MIILQEASMINDNIWYMLYITCNVYNRWYIINFTPNPTLPNTLVWGISHFSKSSLYASAFLWKTYSRTCFHQPTGILREFLLVWKKVKIENSIQHFFCSELPQRQCTPWAAERPARSSTQHPGIQPPQLWAVSVRICALFQLILCIR